MKILLLFLSIFNFIRSQPGAPWTEEEALIVKAKLYAIIGQYGDSVGKEYLSLHPELGLETWPEPPSNPSAAKFLRLGFHQCLKFSDGSGGCNGCLNNHGMGLENRHNCTDDNKFGMDNPNTIVTNNAGLEFTADVLEEIYTNKDFPSKGPSLEMSLAESGKSRADFWTFASAVAAEWGIERNNRGCEGADDLGDVGKGCLHLRATDPDCKVVMPDEIKFFTGRSDCDDEPGLKGWETTKEEHHPNPHGNGVMTSDFFKNDFGLSGRESAALLIGAHSFGTFNGDISQFRYDWTRKQASMLNNQLFRNVAMKPQYFLECRDENPFTGDYLGQPAETRWKVVSRRCATGMGPFQWFHQYYRCPAGNTCTGIPQSDVLLQRNPVHEYPEDVELSRMLNLMRAEPDWNESKGCCKNLEPGHKCQTSCMRYIQNDETALSVDMGYYLDFNVDPETGRPTGCPAFDEDPEYKRTGIADCEKQMYAPEGEPLNEIVEDFAESQTNWIRDFLTGFEKMSNNGYDASELTPGPKLWFGAKCSIKRIKGQGKKWICE